MGVYRLLLNGVLKQVLLHVGADGKLANEKKSDCDKQLCHLCEWLNFLNYPL